MKTIVVIAGKDLETLESKGCDFEDTFCDTIAEAKRRAKYVLTDRFAALGEMSEPFGYSRVIVNGEIHSDFFRD